MAIRLRTVELEGVGKVRVALCAVETDPLPGDVYLDDGDHYALAAKFNRDYETGIVYEVEWSAMDTQKLRDAKEELEKWSKSIMCQERQKQLTMDGKAAMTPEEIAAGYHWCMEWDGLVISPNEAEWGEDKSKCRCGYKPTSILQEPTP